MYALMQSCGYAITVKKVTRILAECQERVSVSISVSFEKVTELLQFV